MGQTQSSRGQSIDEGVIYHPSAIGYSVPSSSPSSRKLKLLYNGNNDESDQKSSMTGPMRTRVKSRQPNASFSPALAATQQGREHTSSSSSSMIPFEQVDDVAPLTSTPSISANPDNSNRGNEHRISAIPIQPSIKEVPEPGSVNPIRPRSLDEDNRRFSEPVSPALADALKIGLGKRYLNSQTLVSPPNVSTNLNHEIVSNGLPSSRPSSQRHSWNSELEQETTSPSQIMVQQWTSQWEDCRGLGISNDGSNEEEPYSTASDLRFAAAAQNTQSPTKESSLYSPGKVKRKPVPIVEDWDQLDSSTQTTPIEVGNQQRILWPAPAEVEENFLSKHDSYVSRASATTEALHSHVEKLRAGPVYQVDPDASALFQANDSINDSMKVNNPPSVSASPINKRSRGLSFMAKIKDRVRKNSDATILSSPIAPSPSTPGFSFNGFSPSPSSPFNTIDTRLGQENSLSPQSRSLYLLGRKKSNKKAKIVATQAQLYVHATSSSTQEQSKRRSVPSSRSRSSRQSVRSVNSAKSLRSKRSRRSNLESSEEKENESTTFTTKQRSSSQPLPNNQQWWKGQITWPRRASVGLRSRNNRRDEADSEAGWIDEDDGDQARSVPNTITQRRKRITRHAERNASSPTGEELLAMEQKRAPRKEKNSRPLVVIGRANLPLLDQYTYGSVQYSSSTSFTSLAPPPVQTPMPPPRRSRKAKQADSSSNRENSSSAAASPLTDLHINTMEDLNKPASSGRISPLSVEMNQRDVVASSSTSAVNHVSNSPKTVRHSHEISDAGSKEILLSDNSSDQYWQETQLEGDQTDCIATMQPSVDFLERHVQSAALSRFGPRHQSLALQEEEEDEDEDDGFTVTEPMTSTRRPLPTPPVLAEPRTVLDTVTRSNSTGSTRAGSSTYGGQTSIASMKKHTGTQRRPLTPTPGTQSSEAPHRAVSLPSKSVSPIGAAIHEPEDEESGLMESLTIPEQKAGLVRESWTSADGPWQAETMQAKTISPAKGMAKATVQSGKQASPLQSRREIIDSNWSEDRVIDQTEITASNPVPFAETAVQASLAALEAIERSKQGNNWQSRWAREKLMGTLAIPSKVPFPATSSSRRNDPSTSEMSDYSNSRSRRRAAPYVKSREDVSSSTEERARRKATKKKSQSNRQLMMSTSASQIGGHSSFAEGGFTSDSDRAVLNYRQRRTNNTTESRRTKSSICTTADGSIKAATHSIKRRPIPNFSPLDSSNALEEGVGKMVAPALAKRLAMEGEGEVIHKDKNKPHRADDSDDGKTCRSRRTRRRSESKKHHPSSSFTVSLRVSKTRKGYGCDDIKAWQASLDVAAAIPVSLVE